VDFMRDVGKHFTVNYMLAKDSVKSRIEGGISYTEFSYMLLQAYDFLQLHRKYGATLQTGGSDQWGNITAGIELIRRADGKEAHGLTLPLVTTASGAKFGKTESGTVWLDTKLTSPYRFLQFWVNVDDRDVGKYLRYFTLLSEEEIQVFDRMVVEHPERRDAQLALAQDVTMRVHGAEATKIAVEASGVLFGKSDPHTLSADVFSALAKEVPSATIRVQDAATVADLFVQAAVVKSKGEARRLADQGGMYVNGERTAGNVTVADLSRLAGSHVLLRKGARDYAVVTLVE
jgi:tyrosyl-tRNA synthetase